MIGLQPKHLGKGQCIRAWSLCNTNNLMYVQAGYHACSTIMTFANTMNPVESGSTPPRRTETREVLRDIAAYTQIYALWLWCLLATQCPSSLVRRLLRHWQNTPCRDLYMRVNLQYGQMSSLCQTCFKKHPAKLRAGVEA